MNAACCCQSGVVTLAPPRRSFARRCARSIEWLVPAIVLAAMPKCPACVAAYVGMATGLGISVSSAAQLRGAALVVCVTSLAWLVIARGMRMRRTADVGQGVVRETPAKSYVAESVAGAPK